MRTASRFIINAVSTAIYKNVMEKKALLLTLITITVTVMAIIIIITTKMVADLIILILRITP